MGNEAWRNKISKDAQEAAKKYGFTIFDSVDAQHKEVLV
jgi:hypothetical protein